MPRGSNACGYSNGFLPVSILLRACTSRLSGVQTAGEGIVHTRHPTFVIKSNSPRRTVGRLLLAKQLRSPRAIDRMTDYVRHGYARNMEMLADEMLAICADAEAWREKKESREAQAKYNEYLYGRRGESEDE